MAAAGSFALCIGGFTPCETDYLAASGAVFPPVPVEDLDRFNRETMRDFMDEAAEQYDRKKPALDFWLNVEFPRVRAGLAQVLSGYAGSTDDFETLAPAVTLAD